MLRGTYFEFDVTVKVPSCVHGFHRSQSSDGTLLERRQIFWLKLEEIYIQKFQSDVILSAPHAAVQISWEPRGLLPTGGHRLVKISFVTKCVPELGGNDPEFEETSQYMKGIAAFDVPLKTHSL